MALIYNKVSVMKRFTRKLANAGIASAALGVMAGNSHGMASFRGGAKSSASDAGAINDAACGGVTASDGGALLSLHAERKGSRGPGCTVRMTLLNNLIFGVA